MLQHIQKLKKTAQGATSEVALRRNTSSALFWVSQTCLIRARLVAKRGTEKDATQASHLFAQDHGNKIARRSPRTWTAFKTAKSTQTAERRCRSCRSFERGKWSTLTRDVLFFFVQVTSNRHNGYQAWSRTGAMHNFWANFAR